MDRPIVSFVIVTYQSAETIRPCLESIRTRTRVSYEIAIVDNSPTRETIEAIERFQAVNPDVKLSLIKPAQNIGFGRACNVGAQQTTGIHLFFLNPDTVLLNDAAAFLVAGLDEQPNAMIVGPAIRNSEGEVTRTCRNLPTLARIILDATGLDQWFGAYKLTRFAHDRPLAVEQIIGAAMLILREDFERVGGMDEQFFIYFEEVDLCKRIQANGGEIWFWPDAAVQHLAGRSCETDSVRARMIFVLRESRKRYFAKHFGVRGAFAVELVNRLEALEKLTVLSILWLLGRKRSHREKMSGFWAVATGNASRI